MPGTVLDILMKVMMMVMVVATMATAITGHALHVHGVRHMHSPTLNHGKRGFMVSFFNGN